MGARFSRNHPVRRPPLQLLPLCLAIAGAVHAKEIVAPTWALCANPATLPMFAELPTDSALRESSPTDISADDLDVKKADTTIFSGKVQMTHADQYLATDKVTYAHETEQFTTEGEVHYQDRGVRLTAQSATGDQKADILRLGKVRYQFNEQLGNGIADTATMHGEQGTLTDATYSTCPPGQRQWEFVASRISVDNAKAKGVAHNVTLRLGGVPVLWLPVISFPTDNKRRTGVLAPTIGRDDRNGLDFKLPVYINLAPNYDATLAPHWYSKRGLMLEGEFRYLTARSTGDFSGTYLPNDNIRGRDRSDLNFRDTTTLSRHWYFNADLHNVSDKNYFSDFGNSLVDTSISLLGSTVGVYGRGKYWSSSLTAENWQIASQLLSDGDEPYRRLPRLLAAANRPFARWFEAGLNFEAVRFSHDSFAEVAANATRYDGGNRVDLQPWVRLPFGGAAWYITPQLAWRYTHYETLDGLPVGGGVDLVTGLPIGGGAASSATRSLPIASLDAGAFFERNFQWGGKPYVQTLEPRLYYLRVPYRNQDDLPLFDTRELTFGWTSLFRDNRFGGADRQGDANQMSLSLTSRILSAADGRERLSAGIGRITYFDAPKVGLSAGAPLPSADGSDWIATLDWQVNDHWRVGATQQWDSTKQRTDLSSIRGQYRFDRGGVVNVAYRFRRDLLNQPALEQTDLSFVIPVKDKWKLYGRWNYSLHDAQSAQSGRVGGQTLDALAGFEWSSCCVAVRLLGRQYVRSFDSRKNLGLYLEIELNGLGSFGRDTARLLDNAILGYAR